MGYFIYRNFVKVVHYAVDSLFTRHVGGPGNTFAVNKSEMLQVLMNCR